MGWWEFEAGSLKHPGYFRERSVLWRAGVLSQEERSELELQWQMDFDSVQRLDARTRREHYEYHDIPAELIEQWQAERRRRKRQSAPVAEAAAK
jgi:hypothetical protein